MRDDTARAVKEFGVKTLLTKKSIEEAEKAILPGETVLAIQCSTFDISCQGQKKPDGYVGTFFLTEKALYFYSHIQFVSANERVPLENITAVGVSTPNILTYIKFDVVSRTYSLQVDNKYIELLNERIKEAMQKVKQQTVVSKPSDQDDDIFAKIEKLADLCDRGILTEEEFQQKKKEWLASI